MKFTSTKAPLPQRSAMVFYLRGFSWTSQRCGEAQTQERCDPRLNCFSLPVALHPINRTDHRRPCCRPPPVPSSTIVLRQHVHSTINEQTTQISSPPKTIRSTARHTTAPVARGHAGREWHNVHPHVPRGGGGPAHQRGAGVVFLRRHGVRLEGGDGWTGVGVQLPLLCPGVGRMLLLFSYFCIFCPLPSRGAGESVLTSSLDIARCMWLVLSS